MKFPVAESPRNPKFLGARSSVTIHFQRGLATAERLNLHAINRGAVDLGRAVRESTRGLTSCAESDIPGRRSLSYFPDISCLK